MIQEKETERRPAAVLEKTSALRKWLFGIAVAAILGVFILLIHSTDDHKTKDTLPVQRKMRTEQIQEVRDSINGHEWVDLGLPSGTRWASANVGASSPSEFGDYYAWGETQPKEEYIDINCLTHRKDFNWLKEQGIIGEDGCLTSEHDIATTEWGKPWRMPTDDEFRELLDNCTFEFTDYDGVNGYMATGPNGESIFLVAAGFKQGSEAEYTGDYGDYWSATVVPELIGAACSLGYSSKAYGRRRYARFAGRTVRPVTD